MRKAILWLLTICVVVSLLTVKTLKTSGQNKQDDLKNTSRWQLNNDNLKRLVETRGRAEFTEDYKDVRDVTPGGYVKIEEERDGQSRRYEVRHDLGGQLTRSFFINGRAHAIDDEARTWIAKMVLQAVRQGGIDADKRVQTILRQSGVDGVLAEIDQIESDYARRF